MVSPLICLGLLGASGRETLCPLICSSLWLRGLVDLSVPKFSWVSFKVGDGQKIPLPISHLQFVDGVARIMEVANFKRNLDIYLVTLGQKINEDKSSIFFFNTPCLIQSRIARILRFQIGSLPFVYLGTPFGLGVQRRQFL